MQFLYILGELHYMIRKKNAGFSLVELIIVIAIMAILVSVLVPQYIRYVEKSRIAKDMDVASKVQQAVAVAMVDSVIKDRPENFGPRDISGIDDGTMPEFAGAVKESIGVSSLNTFSADNIRSKTYAGNDIILEIDSSLGITRVSVSANYAGEEAILIE